MIKDVHDDGCKFKLFKRLNIRNPKPNTVYLKYNNKIKY